MSRRSKPARRRWWWTLWSLLAVSAAGTAIASALPYLPPDSATSQIPLGHNAAHYASIVAHAFPGIVALFLGPFQFLMRLRARYPMAHRITGRVYMIAVVLASAAALGAATFSTSGIVAQVGLYLLAVSWLYTLTKAYRTIRRGEVQLHRIWMIRNYALTFAAVMLRVYLGIGTMLQTPYPSLAFGDIYDIAVWGSFLGNVLVAEYFIINRTLKPLARREIRSPGPGVRSREADRGGAKPMLGSSGVSVP